MHFLENSMFILNAYFCRELKFVAILRSKLRFLLRISEAAVIESFPFYDDLAMIKLQLMKSCSGSPHTSLPPLTVVS